MYGFGTYASHEVRLCTVRKYQVLSAYQVRTYAALWICVSWHDDLMGLGLRLDSREIGIGKWEFEFRRGWEGVEICLF